MYIITSPLIEEVPINSIQLRKIKLKLLLTMWYDIVRQYTN